MKPHGTLRAHFLIKTGKQVQKFWKYNGYGVATKDLEQCRGVELHTQYDGILFAPRHTFYQSGIPHNFNGEEQLILPVQYWENITKRNYWATIPS